MSERVFVTGVGSVLPEGERPVPTERGRSFLAAAVESPDLSAVPPLARPSSCNASGGDTTPGCGQIRKMATEAVAAISTSPSSMSLCPARAVSRMK